MSPLFLLGVGIGLPFAFVKIFSSSRKEFLVDWNAIKAEYIAGGTSYRKLCEKYGVSRTTLQRKAKDENWVELRSQAEAKTESIIVKSVSRKKAKTADKIIDVADKLLNKISEFVETIPLDMMSSTQALKHLTSALKDLKDIKGFKTDADMREQEARIRNLERQAEAESTDNEIKVVIEGGLDKYST